MAFVDPATRCFEITEIPVKSSARNSHIFNNTWLPRYQRPQTVTLTMEMSSKKTAHRYSKISTSNPLQPQ